MANNANTVSVPQAVNQSLDQLIKQRAAAAALFAKANAALYLVLGECKVLADATDKIVLKQACKDRGIEVKNNTHVYSLVLYIVFSDITRQKVSAYAAVLKKAEEAKLTSAAVVARWIASNNGIEAIRTGSQRTNNSPDSSNVTTNAPNAQASTIAASNPSLQVSEEVPQEDDTKPEQRAKDFLAQGHGGVELDASFFPVEMPMGSVLAMLVEPTATGTYKVTFVTNSQSAVRPLLVTLGRELDREQADANSLILSDVIDSKEAELEAAIQAAREATSAE
ncbi:hypothetical protein ACQKGL_19585 [Ensifer adhaerens]|uniref:hypothetical protein n=1 Tax=Ensifer adhaerens TaxID=106592 RepID=UPI003CFD24C1